MPPKKKSESTSTDLKPKTKRTSAKVPRKPAEKAPKTPKAPKRASSRSAKTIRRIKAAGDPMKLSSASSLKKLPRRGETQMVAFIRDPQCLFTYWEVSPEDVEAVKKQLMGEYQDSSMVLMVFKTGPHGEAELLYEIKVEPGERNRYLELKEPGGRYFIQIAQKTASGRVIPYTRSNLVVTGAASGSEPSTDPQWMPPSGILEYFSDEEQGDLSPIQPWGISSAEWQKRKKEKEARWEARYAASRKT